MIQKISIVFVLLCTGCVGNYYSQFYDVYDIHAVQNEGTTTDPKLYVTEYLERDMHNAIRKNYILFAESAFEASSTAIQAQDDKLKFHARKIGAELVILSRRYKYQEESTRVQPRYVPEKTTKTETTGRIGRSNVTATTRTKEPARIEFDETQVNESRLAYNALYFVKRKIPPRLGIIHKNLPPELRQELERNTGVVVSVVIDDSPAFYSNIIEGDVIISVNGTPVRNTEYFRELLDVSGDECRFEILRKGNLIEKVVQLYDQGVDTIVQEPARISATSQTSKGVKPIALITASTVGGLSLWATGSHYRDKADVSYGKYTTAGDQVSAERYWTQTNDYDKKAQLYILSGSLLLTTAIVLFGYNTYDALTYDRPGVDVSIQRGRNTTWVNATISFR